MVRVLYNTDDHHQHGDKGASASATSAVADSLVLGSHRCRCFDMHALLTEARWLGTRALQLELVSSSRDSMDQFCARLKLALAGGAVSARIRVLSPCTVRLSR